jgi:hypothetical protein
MLESTSCRMLVHPATLTNTQPVWRFGVADTILALFDKQIPKRKCEWCKGEFVPLATRQKYCCDKHRNKASHIREREALLILKCQYCEKEYKPQRHSKGMYCSHQCKNRHQRNVPLGELPEYLKPKQLRQKPFRQKPCKICGVISNRAYCSRECELECGRRQSREKLRQYKPILETKKKCADCNCEFTVKYITSHEKRIRCAVCQRKRNRANHCNGSNEQRAKRAGVVYQYINKEKVFERDGWRCHICKRKTPKRYMGTYHNRAPELDHVNPLAVQGPHTYENVRCCCRECNGNKGATPLGQPMLLGMIPTQSIARKRVIGAG